MDPLRHDAQTVLVGSVVDCLDEEALRPFADEEIKDQSAATALLYRHEPFLSTSLRKLSLCQNKSGCHDRHGALLVTWGELERETTIHAGSRVGTHREEASH